MFLSDIENAVFQLSQPQMIAVALVVFAALAIYARFFQRIAVHGPKTRPDLLALPEMMTAAVIMGLFAFTIAVRFFAVKQDGGTAENVPVETLLLKSMAAAAVPALAIIVMLVARGGRVQNVFGLGKVHVLRAIGLGLGLALLAMPLTLAAKAILVILTGSHEAPQALVQKFNAAVGGGDTRLQGLIALSAVVVAPLTEEVLFRGMFYPMLSRSFGRGPAALAVALLFAFVHDTYTDVPGLVVLSLCLTVAYEVTGSLLVPIFMHASFNGVSLVVMWLQAQAGQQ